MKKHRKKKDKKQHFQCKKEKAIPQWKIPWWMPLLIVSVGIALCYSHTLSVPFHFDDRTSIVENGAIKNLSHVAAIWSFTKTRFLTYLTFAINYHFHGLKTWGYHIVNIVLHGICSILLWRLVLLTFTTPGLSQSVASQDNTFFALLSALLFAVHPLQTQAVTYIVQRAAVLAALFYFLSLYCYIKARMAYINGRSIVRQAIWWLCCGVSSGLGLFTKENFYTLPLTVITYEILFLKRAVKSSLKPIAASLLLIISTGFLIFTIKPDFDQLGRIEMPGGYIQLTPASYVLTQLRVLITYLRLFLFPINLNIDHDVALSRGIGDPSTLLSGALLAGFFLLGIYCMRAGRKLCAFGIFWFFITLLVESSIIPIRDVIFEHRMYLPLAGLTFVITDYVSTLLKKNFRVTSMLTIIIVVLLAIQTYMRNTVWQSKESLWSDAIKKSPRKARPWAMRGEYYLEAGEYDKAIDDARQALALNPTSLAANNVLGCALYLQKRYDEALKVFNRILHINPFSYEHYFNRAQIYSAQEHFDNATRDLTKAIELSPYNDELYLHRGLVFIKQNQLDKAREDFSFGLSINPRSHGLLFHRAFVYYHQRNYAAALGDCTAALDLQPNDAEIFNLRGLTYAKLGNINQALADFSAAIASDPTNGEYYNNRAVTLFMQKNYDDALRDVEKALHLGTPVNQEFLSQLLSIKDSPTNEPDH